MTRAWSGVVAGVVAVLAGCGHAPETAAPALGAGSKPTPAPVTAVAPTAPDGAALLAHVRAAFAAATGAEAEATAYSDGHYKAGALVSELRHSTYKTRMLWSKPRKVSGQILATDNFLVGGARMVSLDGKSVKVRGAGLLGIFPITLDVGADMLSSNRHHKFGDQTADAICSRLLGTSARWTVIGQTTIGGTTVLQAQVDGVPHLDKEITREVVAIDPAVAALRGVTTYVGEHMVEDVKFTKFLWNPHVAADAFDL